MSRVTRVGAHVAVELTEHENALLGALLNDYREILSAGAAHPELGRLFPAAYADDPDATRAFSERTRDAATARKLDNADLVSTALGLEPPLELGAAVVERWLRVLTDLRLVLAERLDLRTDDDAVPDTELGFVYQWLGLLQQLMIDALEEEA